MGNMFFICIFFLQLYIVFCKIRIEFTENFYKHKIVHCEKKNSGEATLIKGERKYIPLPRSLLCRRAAWSRSTACLCGDRWRTLTRTTFTAPPACFSWSSAGLRQQYARDISLLFVPLVCFLDLISMVHLF